ncbi:aldo/keto reductase [Bacillus pumilus]|uniref:aldo/keto reductase n=1 Tax=Bacillus pumilus TaxID=1408 RepID=UPI0005C5CA56|nr:aldo/keto reductase [Bacillus pumilus]
MKKRRIGTSDLLVSEAALGCMSLGTEKGKVLSLLDEAIDLGINYLDTADLYDFGTNEEIVGEAIKNRRQDLILATKGGNRFEKGKSGWDWDPSKAYIKEAVKQSLKRLQTDYIDLYQLHGGTINDPIDETIEAFEELVEEGVIRYYGISSIRPNVIKEYAKKSNIVSVMMQYSLLDRRPEEWFSLLEEQGISVVARGPLAKGLLTEKPLSQASASIQKNGYLQYSFDELQQVIPSLKKVAYDLSLTELSIQYLLKNSAVSSVVFGASSVEQLKENAAAANARSLSDQEAKALTYYTKPSVYEAHRFK